MDWEKREVGEAETLIEIKKEQEIKEKPDSKPIPSNQRNPRKQSQPQLPERKTGEKNMNRDVTSSI